MIIDTCPGCGKRPTTISKEIGGYYYVACTCGLQSPVAQDEIDAALCWNEWAIARKSRPQRARWLCLESQLLDEAIEQGATYPTFAESDADGRPIIIDTDSGRTWVVEIKLREI